MKCILLYGPGEVGKRAQLQNIKQGFSSEDISVIDLKQEGWGKVLLTIQSNPLFSSDNRLVVVENIGESLPIENLSLNTDNVTLVILAPNLRANATLLTIAKKVGAQTMLFEGEQEVSAFPFVDSLIERKRITFLELKKLLDEYGGMYVLSMVYYGLRRNILPLPRSSYASQKIVSQKKLYQEKDWSILYQLTIETEAAIKTGRITEDLGLYSLVERFLVCK